MHGMHRFVAVVHLGTHDLAAVQIQDQVQVELDTTCGSGDP